MSEFEELHSLKNGEEKDQKLIEYYKETVKIESWLNNDFKKSIVVFKDRTEYKKFNKYHRLNGPAIDYGDEKLNKYYYKGELYKEKVDWEKVTLKEVRKLKIKKINSQYE